MKLWLRIVLIFLAIFIALITVVIVVSFNSFPLGDDEHGCRVHNNQLFELCKECIQNESKYWSLRGCSAGNCNDIDDWGLEHKDIDYIIFPGENCNEQQYCW